MILKFFKNLFSFIFKGGTSKKKSRKRPELYSVDDSLGNEKTPFFKFSKYTHNPVISPNDENPWETWQTFNPGVVQLEKDSIHFIYRAIGNDGLSRFGYAFSKDGFQVDYKNPKPVYEHNIDGTNPFEFVCLASGGGLGGCEDPRLAKVSGDENIYMTYTACDRGLRVALSSIKVEDFLNKVWNWTPAKLISPPGEVHKNWVIFPEKIKGKYAIIHSINPKIQVEYLDDLEFRDVPYISSVYGGAKAPLNRWDNWIRGVGPPPIKTKEGWLLFYHAMDKRDPGKYKVGAMLLDLKDPTKVLHRADAPLLEPDEWYENEGFKSGVVYAIGSAIMDDTLFLYYGAADSYICVAHAELDDLLSELVKNKAKKLKVDIIPETTK